MGQEPMIDWDDEESAKARVMEALHKAEVEAEHERLLMKAIDATILITGVHVGMALYRGAQDVSEEFKETMDKLQGMMGVAGKGGELWMEGTAAGAIIRGDPVDVVLMTNPVTFIPYSSYKIGKTIYGWTK